MVDFFCRERKADLVVRYAGGANAAHNVVLEDGTHHTFASFGSGTLAGVRTHLSKHFMLDPYALLKEAAVLDGKGYGWALDRLTIDYNATIVTPWHILANRMREIARGDARHGSVGMGIGEARADRINGLWFTASDFQPRPRNWSSGKLKVHSERKIAEMEPFSKVAPQLFAQMKAASTDDFAELCEMAVKNLRDDATVIGNSNMVVMEGSQGVLLDEFYGFAPYNTWSDVTSRSALALLGSNREVERIGVLRTYLTRHGAGPFPTEGMVSIPEKHNATHPFMGQFRTGAFDCELARYAVQCCDGIDSLALTHMDRIHSHYVADEYGPIINSADWLYGVTPKYFRASPFVQGIEERLGVHAGYTSHGPAASDKLSCRAPVYR